MQGPLPSEKKTNELLQIPSPSLDLPKQVILDMIKKWRIIGWDFNTLSQSDFKTNFEYYRGKFISDNNIPDKKSKVVDNRIFMSLETQIPMVTDKPAVPVVKDRHTTQSKNEGKNIERLHQKLLTWIYTEKSLKLQQKLEKVIRQSNLYKSAFLKYWLKDGKIFVDYVLPDKLYIDNTVYTLADSVFVWEDILLEAWELLEKYPESEIQILDKMWESYNTGTKIKITEWRTDEYLFITMENDTVLLEAKENPLYIKDKGKEKTSNALYDQPRKPYISYNVYNIGDQVRDTTTNLEQTKALQDDLNSRLRQISDNAKITANPHLKVVWSTKETVVEWNSEKEAGDALRLKPWDDVAYLNPWNLPNYIMNTLIDLRAEIDNIWGIHWTSRWEKGGAETATGREILSSSDQGRQSPIGRWLERMLVDLYDAFTHLVDKFYLEDDLVPFLGKKEAKEYLKLRNNNKWDGLEIQVVPWSTLPDDPIAIKAQSLELMNAGKITVEKLYENLGFESPEEEAKKFYQEQAVIEKEQQKILAEWEQAKASAESGQNQLAGIEQQINQMQ